MNFEECDVNACTSYSEFNSILETVIPKGVSKWDALFYLNENAKMWKITVDGKVVGIFSAEDDGKFMECHAYMFPQWRRHSITALRGIVAHCKMADRIPKTVVSSDALHVIKVLEKLGLSVDSKGTIERLNGVFDTYTLTYK